MFEHTLMRKVSRRVADSKSCPFKGEDPSTVASLREVAKCFVELQDMRHTADYDGTVVWNRIDARVAVRKAEIAFDAWHSIRHHKIAQDYLVSLLIKPRD